MDYLKILLTICFIYLFSLPINSKEFLRTCEETENQVNNNQIKKKFNVANKNSFKIHFCKGQKKLELKQFNEAVVDFKKANELANNDLDKSVSILFTVSSLRQSNRPLDAITLANDFLKSSNLNKNFIHSLLAEIAKSYQNLNNFNETIQYFKEAYKVAANDEERAEDLSFIASTYVMNNNYEMAIEYEIKASLAFEKIGNYDLYVESGIKLASYYSEISNVSAAEKTLLKLENFSRDNGGMYYLAKILYLESNFYKLNSNLPLSIRKFDEGSKIAKEINAEDLLGLFNTR